jgi:hypothetical protein
MWSFQGLPYSCKQNSAFGRFFLIWIEKLDLVRIVCGFLRVQFRHGIHGIGRIKIIRVGGKKSSHTHHGPSLVHKKAKKPSCRGRSRVLRLRVVFQAFTSSKLPRTRFSAPVNHDTLTAKSVDLKWVKDNVDPGLIVLYLETTASVGAIRNLSPKR